MKRILLTLALSLTYLLSGEHASMSEADKKMYAEMLENNPGDIFVANGEEEFEENLGSEEALAKLLEVPESKLAEYIAGFPRYVKKMGNVVGLDQVLQVLQVKQGKKKKPLDSEEMYALVSYVKSLANDENITIDVNSSIEMREANALGKKLYVTARGGRGLGCIGCHRTSGTLLRTQTLPHLGEIGTGATWPAYRMTQSAVVSMQKRFQGCMKDSMQSPLPLGSKEMVALEVYITNLAKENKKVVAIPGLKR